MLSLLGREGLRVFQLWVLCPACLPGLLREFSIDLPIPLSWLPAKVGDLGRDRCDTALPSCPPLLPSPLRCPAAPGTADKSQPFLIAFESVSREPEAPHEGQNRPQPAAGAAGSIRAGMGDMESPEQGSPEGSREQQ